MFGERGQFRAARGSESIRLIRRCHVSIQPRECVGRRRRVLGLA
jgi:hypothetical protein